jgi:hypothetical protein
MTFKIRDTSSPDLTRRIMRRIMRGIMIEILKKTTINHSRKTMTSPSKRRSLIKRVHKKQL